MPKLTLGLFDFSVKNMFHYVLIILLLFGWFYIGEQFLNLTSYNDVQMGIFWFIGLVLADSITHKVIRRIR